jgi:hypothetical protein
VRSYSFRHRRLKLRLRTRFCRLGIVLKCQILNLGCCVSLDTVCSAR